MANCALARRNIQDGGVLSRHQIYELVARTFKYCFILKGQREIRPVVDMTKI